MDPNFHHQQYQNHEEGGVVATGSKSGSYLCRQSSARWIPTGDQIRILRDLYYNYGVRSPSAEQIQRISAKLRQYGKIEGKNVFYWFQNHKARERQKKRLTADIANSTANKFGSVSMCSYDAGQFGNGGSVSGEKSFKGCCLSGGEMTESSTVGWFGFETAFQVTPWPYQGGIGGQEIVTPVSAARAIETLPLFPIHAQENDVHEVLPNSFYCGGDAVGLQSQEESMNGYQQSRRGGNEASLELTLNSQYEPSSSI